MSDDIAVKLENIVKIYRLYDSSQDRLKESLHPLRKKYHHDFYALNDVSIEIKKGETVGIIGKNGSGKSTLLKIITGVLTPTSGKVAVDGKVSALLELGAGFNPDLTGMENVYFNGTLMGYTKDEMDQRLDDILSFADIGHFIHQPVKSYSSGMFIRLAFGVSINVDPDILIVDEALSVGDIRFQRKCFAKIDQFRESGKTILFVSHGMDTINTFCSKAVLLNDGTVLEEGIPKYVTRIFQKMMLDEDIKDKRLEKLLEGDISSITCNNQISETNVKDGCLQNNCNDLDRVKNIAIERLKVNNGDKKAEIIDYGILDELGNRVTLLETGKAYTLFSSVVSYANLEKVHLGYPIRNVHGLILFGVNSDIQKVRVKPQNRGGIQHGRVAITMWLAPGNYFLSFRAGNNSELYDELPDAIYFVVTGDCAIISTSIVNLNAKVFIEDVV